eukprot:895269-Rhodomonas_salina.1
MFCTAVQKCCAFVLKPLAYLQRGVMPPRSLQTGMVFFGGEGFENPVWWNAVFFRMVWAYLACESYSKIRYGPKPNDIYHSLPAFYDGDAEDPVPDGLVYINCCGHDRISLESAGISLCFQIRRRGVCMPAGVYVNCSIRDETFQENLVHIIAAKVISHKTGIPMAVCRQMGVHSCAR